MDTAGIKDFARQWDPRDFHLDEEAAAKTIYGGLIASGFHTMLTAFVLTVQADVWAKASMGSPGMDEIRWKAPVRPNDTLRVRAPSKAPNPPNPAPTVAGR